MDNYFLKQKLLREKSRPLAPIGREEAIKMMEISYLASASALIWIALYYLPIGGAFFRLVLPLPLALLQVRRGAYSGVEGVSLAVILLFALMGPVRGPLVLFPYGLLAVWLGWSWQRRFNWWISWSGGIVLGTIGFVVRVIALSLLLGENLWVVITRAGAGLLERCFDLFNISITPDIFQVQMAAFFLVIIQETIYVLTLHALAYWIFPRLKAYIPEPPKILNGLVVLDQY